MCHDKSFYDRHIAPRLVHIGCSADEFASMRERIVPRATGIVVEIGFGSGLNLPHYDPRKIDLLIGIEPDEAMLQIAEDALSHTPFPAELHRAFAERLPLQDAVADSVVVTYTLCTIADPARALKEIRRILKPDGRLLFCEHGAAHGRRATLQRSLNGAWGKLFGGCNITRDPVVALEAAGFATNDVVAKPFPLPQMLLGMHYSGEARARVVRRNVRSIPARTCPVFGAFEARTCAADHSHLNEMSSTQRGCAMNKLALALLLVLVSLVPASAGDLANLTATLKQGGYVIVFRHTATDESQKDVYPFRFDDMKAQRQLSDKGREDARAIGASLKQLGIPLGEIYTSKLNRAVETGKLIAGKDVAPKDELTDSGAGSASKMANPEGDNEKIGRAIRHLVGSAPSTAVNSMLVTHKTNIADAFGKDFADVSDGEALIFRAGSTAPVLVARVRANEWSGARN